MHSTTPKCSNDKTYVKELINVIGSEIKTLDSTAKQIWSAVYKDRFREYARGADMKDDLAEERIQPVLKEISQAGFDYLDRAYTAYTHALELVGSNDALLNQVAALAVEISEYEIKVARLAA